MAHSVTLGWTASTDMPNPIPAGDGYNIYKGDLPAADGATPINGATPVTADSYIDTAVVFGQTYDYYVTAVVAGKESVASQHVQASVSLPAAPTGVTAVAI